MFQSLRTRDDAVHVERYSTLGSSSSVLQRDRLTESTTRTEAWGIMERRFTIYSLIRDTTYRNS